MQEANCQPRMQGVSTGSMNTVTGLVGYKYDA